MGGAAQPDVPFERSHLRLSPGIDVFTIALMSGNVFRTREIGFGTGSHLRFLPILSDR